MRKFVILLLLLIVFQLSANDLTRYINAFSFKMMQKADNRENLLLSPYSIHKALAMTAEGAQSETESEMFKVLYTKDIEKAYEMQLELDETLSANAGDEVIWNQANSIWADKSLKLRKKFKKKLTKFYSAEINRADFQNNPANTLKLINNWVSDKTNEKIPSILKNINPQDRMVLCNAVYFLGDWVFPFNEHATHDDVFTKSNKEKIETSYMQQTHEFGYFENKSLQALAMPYKGSSFTMMVLLPKHNKKNLSNLVNLQIFEEIASNLSPKKVVVKMPKFKIEYERELSHDLIALGMPMAFSESADFSNISKSEDLSISRVIHKSYIEVNEKGTEAAAATAVVMKMFAIRPTEPPVEFIADHPFCYFLYDRSSKTILFAGILREPK